MDEDGVVTCDRITALKNTPETNHVSFILEEKAKYIIPSYEGQMLDSTCD